MVEEQDWNEFAKTRQKLGRFTSSLAQRWAISARWATCGPQQPFQWPVEAFSKIFKPKTWGH